MARFLVFAAFLVSISFAGRASVSLAAAPPAPSSSVAATPSAPAAPRKSGFPLVAGGRAAPIVIASSESKQPDLAQAVDDLRQLIARIAGCAAPALILDTKPRSGPFIAVGKTAGMTLREEDLGYDGYVVRSEGGRLALAGPNLAGTANAIYDFIETDLGVRFVAPGPDGTFIPHLRELSIPAAERRSRPAFALREAWYNEDVLARGTKDERESLRRFARRNRAGGIPSVIRHYFAEMVPPAKYFAQHPEYFAQVNGQRVADGQLCTSNSQVRAIVVQHWIDRFTREPELRVGSLSPNDGGGFCTCSICESFGPDLTARLMDFMNDVTRRVNSAFPDRYLSFYAYRDIAEPPYARGNRLQTNLIPMVARYGTCQVHPITEAGCPSNARFRRRLEGWVEIANQIMAREYACLWPVPDLTLPVIASNLRTYRSMGATGVSREYMHRGFLSDLLMRVDLQLQWNPAADADSLFDAALDARFGPAAPDMRAAIAELRAASAAVPPATVIVSDTQSVISIYPVPNLRSAVERLDRLASSTELDPATLAKVDTEARFLRIALGHLEALVATDRYKLTGRPEDRDAAVRDAEQALDQAKPLEGRIGTNSIDDLASLKSRLLSPGLHARFTGDFDYRDDMARGGFSRRDASRIDGFYPSSYGLSLLPGKIGRIAYTFSSAPGEKFTRAELHDLVLHGEARIEVQANGKVYPVSAGRGLDDRELVHDLTPFVRGAPEFTLIFWVRNSTQKAILALDNWEVKGEVR